jgi:hypothetical protein
LNTLQQDSRSLPPERLAAITNYAQQTEVDTFNTAMSYEDYFHRLAERIYKIQKDYEEIQMSKKQQILTTTLTSIDKSAGEQGPPNRTAPQSDHSTLITQIKAEPIDNHHHSNLATASLVSNDKHRISTEGISRLAIYNNASNVTSRADINGNHIERTLIKTEEKSPNIQVRISSFYSR